MDIRIIGSKHKCSLSSPKSVGCEVESYELCSMTTDTEVILQALRKERNELHEKILQVDRIISRVRSIDYNPDIPMGETNQLKQPDAPITQDKAIAFPTTADIKIQALRIFDIVGKAASLSELQSEYTNITGSNYKIREAIRSLHVAGIVKMLKFKNASRGFMWVKTEWLVNSSLMDKYKPLGFDLLYKPENLQFI